MIRIETNKGTYKGYQSATFIPKGSTGVISSVHDDGSCKVILDTDSEYYRFNLSEIIVKI